MAIPAEPYLSELAGLKDLEDFKVHIIGVEEKILYFGEYASLTSLTVSSERLFWIESLPCEQLLSLSLTAVDIMGFSCLRFKNLTSLSLIGTYELDYDILENMPNLKNLEILADLVPSGILSTPETKLMIA